MEDNQVQEFRIGQENEKKARDGHFKKETKKRAPSHKASKPSTHALRHAVSYGKPPVPPPHRPQSSVAPVSVPPSVSHPEIVSDDPVTASSSVSSTNSLQLVNLLDSSTVFLPHPTTGTVSQEPVRYTLTD